MATTRIGLDRLPPAARAAVEEHTGPLLTAEETAEGFNSEIAARVTSATGTWHIKGLRTDHPRVWTQRREAAVAPFLTGLAPPSAGASKPPAGTSSASKSSAATTPTTPPAPRPPRSRLPPAPPRRDLLPRHRAAPRRTALGALRRPPRRPPFLRRVPPAPHRSEQRQRPRRRSRFPGRSGPPGRLGLGDPWSGLARRRLLGHLAHRRRSCPRIRRALGRRDPLLACRPAEGITAFAAANDNVWSEISNADPDPWTLRLATAATAWHAHRRTG